LLILVTVFLVAFKLAVTEMLARENQVAIAWTRDSRTAAGSYHASYIRCRNTDTYAEEAKKYQKESYLQLWQPNIT